MSETQCFVLSCAIINDQFWPQEFLFLPFNLVWIIHFQPSLNKTFSLPSFPCQVLPWGSRFLVHRHGWTWLTALSPSPWQQNGHLPSGLGALPWSPAHAGSGSPARRKLDMKKMGSVSLSVLTDRGFPCKQRSKASYCPPQTPCVQVPSRQGSFFNRTEVFIIHGSWAKYAWWSSCDGSLTCLLRSTPSQSPSSSQWVSNFSERFMKV